MSVIARRSLFLLLLFFSCGKALPALEGIDLQKWKNDPKGCLGDRLQMEPALNKELSKIKGLSEMDVVGLFGRPDRNELFKRNQKFFYYPVSGGRECAGGDSVTTSLVIRFTAMGYAQFVSIQKD